ncbi:glucose-dependent insulinotropic receptor [Engraulis encrasicolus]|uniref:glucose-dependent insulinotropic receptor n=1 Tax=Engraulis encrasicolus TaxID=184585 RepID=UPI002FD01BBD
MNKTQEDSIDVQVHETESVYVVHYNEGYVAHYNATYHVVNGTTIGWILCFGSFLIISTNLLVAVALVLLIRKQGCRSWCFVLNLALADILVGLAITIIADDGIHPRTTPMRKTDCLLRMAFVTCPSAASILTMFLISLDRYVAIKLPLRYARVSGRWATVGSLVLVWMLSLVVGFLPCLVRAMQWEDYQGTCTFFSVIEPRSIILIFCGCFFPVLGVFLYFYLDILVIACGHQRQIRLARKAGTRHCQPSRYWGHVKALRTVALLVGCFTLCWCPFFTVSVVQVLCTDCELYSFLENQLWLMGLSNSLINPLVYACWQREVRQQICIMFAHLKCSGGGCCCCCSAAAGVNSSGGRCYSERATVPSQVLSSSRENVNVPLTSVSVLKPSADMVPSSQVLSQSRDNVSVPLTSLSVLKPTAVAVAAVAVPLTKSVISDAC